MPKMPESEKKEEESAESREEKKEQVCNEHKKLLNLCTFKEDFILK